MMPLGRKVENNASRLETRIIEVGSSKSNTGTVTELGQFEDRVTRDRWIPPNPNEKHAKNLHEAAEYLRSRIIKPQHSQFPLPVAFPTETVYGLGADATNSDAVKGIFKAKGRPSDNPLIVHICDLNMLREILRPGYTKSVAAHSTIGSGDGGDSHPSLAPSDDPIPIIYRQMIKLFWPGPLTILLPNAKNSQLAPEVTAGLATFGARMPDSPLALSLISLTGQPLAAPSANASTKPSPTTAQHVLQDLSGKIELIVSEGEACNIGVESTVVDGLCYPPVILRPGGISIDIIRECPGWEQVRNAYQDEKELINSNSNVPRAPGMKYKHYSPKAPVLLYEFNSSHAFSLGFTASIESLKHQKDDNSQTKSMKLWDSFLDMCHTDKTVKILEEDPLNPVQIGIVRTKHWVSWGGLHSLKLDSDKIGQICNIQQIKSTAIYSYIRQQGELWQKLTRNNSFDQTLPDKDSHEKVAMNVNVEKKLANVFEISLGTDTRQIAHDLFAALREMDERKVQVIFIEGIDGDSDIAAAVMNRLRKAASLII